MAENALDAVLSAGGDIVEMLRNRQTGPNAYPGVLAEYSNWRSEQMAWVDTCVLFNQSYHTVDLEVSGPDAFAMLNHLGINSFRGFVPDRAKQFVPVTPTAMSSATSSCSTSRRTASTSSGARR